VAPQAFSWSMPARSSASPGGGGAGAVLSLAAFVTAVVAKARHERWALLWLPLLLLPALLVASPFWV
jgi:hypothetical protein